MRFTKGIFIMASFFILSGFQGPVDAAIEAVLTREEVRQVVEVQNVALKEGVIYGAVVNKSPTPLEDVRLLVRHIWYSPSEQSLSSSEVFTSAAVIPPGGTQAFAHATSLPGVGDRFFETTVSVAEFTQIDARAMAAVEVGVLGRPIILDDALFDFARSEILPSGKTVLYRLAFFMAENPTQKIKLSGYADSIVISVRDYLVHEGIPHERIVIRRFDKSKTRAFVRPSNMQVMGGHGFGSISDKIFAAAKPNCSAAISTDAENLSKRVGCQPAGSRRLRLE